MYGGSVVLLFLQELETVWYWQMTPNILDNFEGITSLILRFGNVQLRNIKNKDFLIELFCIESEV